MRNEDIRKSLDAGETVIYKGCGNSMTPILKHGGRVIVRPAKEAEVGDIVFCKVHGCYYDHLVKAKNPKRGYLIANNHGHVNGWTHQIFGIVKKYE